MVLAVVDDLLFQSKIRAMAQASGREIVFARRRDAAVAAMVERHPDLVIVDLDREALDPIGFIREVKQSPELAVTPIVGFGSHVQAARLQSARDAGCDRVMARSGFVAALPGLLGPEGDPA